MLVLKNLRANAGDVRDLGSFDPWVGKIPWRRAWQPTPVFLPGESSCLEGGGAWQAIVHRVTQSWMRLKQLIMCAYSLWLLCLACLYFRDSSLCSTINTYFPFSGCILFYHFDILFLFIWSSVDDYLGFLFSLKCMSEWVRVTQLCLTLCDPMDCSLLGFSVHGILQARIREWSAISFQRLSRIILPQTYRYIQVSCDYFHFSWVHI